MDVLLYDAPLDATFYESILYRKRPKSESADKKLFADTVRKSYLQDASAGSYRVFEIPAFREIRSQCTEWQLLDPDDLRLGEWLFLEPELHYSQKVVNGIGGYLESVLILSPSLFQCFAPLCDGILFKAKQLQVQRA
jgi:hypothetical protein